jgi:hypothetical protein
MGPPEHGKAILMFPNGPINFVPRVFPTALNGPTGPCKDCIDAPEWAQKFLPENVSDRFEWHPWSVLKSQHRWSQINPVVFSCPTALNGLTGAGKGGIDVPEWTQLFLSENVSARFEWAHKYA